MFTTLANKNLRYEIFTITIQDGANEDLLMNISETPLKTVGVVVIDSNLTPGEFIDQFAFTLTAGDKVNISPQFNPNGITKTLKLAVFYEV